MPLYDFLPFHIIQHNLSPFIMVGLYANILSFYLHVKPFQVFMNFSPLLASPELGLTGPTLLSIKSKNSRQTICMQYRGWKLIFDVQKLKNESYTFCIQHYTRKIQWYIDPIRKGRLVKSEFQSSKWAGYESYTEVYIKCIPDFSGEMGQSPIQNCCCISEINGPTSPNFSK